MRSEGSIRPGELCANGRWACKVYVIISTNGGCACTALRLDDGKASVAIAELICGPTLAANVILSQ